MEGMGIVLRLRDDLQADLYSHPITADLQIFEQLGDSAAVTDVDGLSIHYDLQSYLHTPYEQGAFTSEVVLIAPLRGISTFTKPFLQKPQK